MEAAVSISSLCKSYRSMLPWARRAVHAVRELNLEIPAGEIFGLLGPNGAGKTTTIKMLAGLVVPDSGRIMFPAFPQRPRIGAVLEGSRNLYWRLSAWENIRYFGEMKGVQLALLRRQAAELLERFDLAARRDVPAQTLSRGMQQKLAVVLAFLGDPELLLLDEPTLGLDVASSVKIQQLLRQLSQERGLTIVITTHQMDIAQSLCRRVGIMRDGAVVTCARVAELVDLFKRQDYLARMEQAAWQRLQQDLAGIEYEVLPAERPGQVAVRFKLPSAMELYPLIASCGRAGVELLEFHQEVPTLEDIFLSITNGSSSGGGQA